MKKVLLAFVMTYGFGLLVAVHAQAPSAAESQQPAAAPPAAAPAASAAVPITAADLKAAVVATDRANGDPAGDLTGNATDIAAKPA